MYRSRRCARRCRVIWRRRVIKLRRETERLRAGLVLREQASGYRVEGEIGRFDFPLYEAVNDLISISYGTHKTVRISDIDRFCAG
jgi:hypothetical protein